MATELRDLVLRILGPGAALLLAVVSDQNPRILLYALILAAVWRFTGVALLVRRIESGQSAVMAGCRPPRDDERSRPYRDQRTGERAGLATYVVGAVSLWCMVAVLQLLANGTGFLQPAVLVPELLWAVVLSLVFFAEDWLTRALIVAPGESEAANLGYNVGAFNFLLGAVFLANLAFLMAGFVLVMFAEGGWVDESLPVQWWVIGALLLLRFAHDVWPAGRGPARRLPG